MTDEYLASHVNIKESIFGSEKIINVQHVNEKLNIYYAGFDLGIYRYKELVEQIQRVIIDFAYGFHEGILEESYNIDILRESAKSIYKIKEFEDVKKIYLNDSEIDDSIEDKYLRRGEFGELILHLILRDFHNSLPLLSKIYFKDSDGHTVHGFDAVHIAPDITDSSKYSLWIGESKLYNDGKAGVKALTKDIEEHFNKDYLRREFALISKKKNSYVSLEEFKDLNKEVEYVSFLEKQDEWYEKLDEREKLEDILSSVTIPMLCTYSSNTFNKYNNEKDKQFLEDLDSEIKDLEEHFLKNLKTPIPVNLNIVLLFFPLPSKKELVKQLHVKLDTMQKI